ncbi:hypothetical protein M8818_007290 [Zalaria obscura]|uniref:Uncharacterized protein n=1 Tax=Zalaria obscura TaxID=2024903 RepID=A0ACC3S8W5_9PEZI
MTVEILIFGAGAVGAFYGSRLANAPDTQVSVVCRSNYKAVKANGFTVKSPQYGDYTWSPTRTFASPEDARKSKTKWDYIVVSTKALPDVSDDSQQLEGLVGDGTGIVLIQNGLGVEGPYNRRFPKATVLSAVTVISAAQPEHGLIQHNRWTRINVGPYLPEQGVEDEKAMACNKKFVELLNAGGVKDASAYSHAKLQLVRWHKIAINAAFNPSSVLSGGSSNATMALDSEAQLHIKGVMDEVLTTGPKVLNTQFPKEFATSEAILRSTQKNTSGSRPSMWADWESGKRMELEVILGNPIRIAREKGFEMPRLQSLYALLKLAQENRDKGNERSKL